MIAGIDKSKSIRKFYRIIINKGLKISVCAYLISEMAAYKRMGVVIKNDSTYIRKETTKLYCI